MKKLISTFFIMAASVSFLAPSAIGALKPSSLSVRIDGFKNQRGQVCLSLFASSKGFPDSRNGAVEARCLKVTDRSVIVNFNNLKVGNYAVALFHDVNSDGKLNRNALGIPTEEFGFSQNPAIITGAPKFADSAVLVAGSTNIQIQLKNLLG